MKIPEKSSFLTEAQKLFSSFLQSNPFSSLELDANDEKKLEIKNPWGDSSLSLIIQEDKKEVAADILNNIYLPERFTAIWHKDTKDFEVIFTAYKLDDDLADIQDRSFNIKYQKIEYACQFSRSSERLLEIAKIAVQTGETSTEHRNISSFKQYIKQKLYQDVEDKESLIGEPISFWVRNMSWDEDKVIELIQHLNFYNRYYDNNFPRIIIHSPKNKAITDLVIGRYREAAFPQNITMHNIDTHLLHYWEASKQGDSSRRFTYSYRILEYVAFSYLETTMRDTIKRTLATPNALDTLDRSIDEVINIINGGKQTPEVQKFDSFIKETISYKLIWQEVSRNIKVFSHTIHFEGGFNVPALVKKEWGEEDFKINGMGAFSSSIRGIRNALSHGRDQKTTCVITPTKHNFELLQPWTLLISVAAAETMIYKRF